MRPLFTSFKINIDLDIITLSEVNQRQRPYDITYVWSLKKKKRYKGIHLQSRNGPTDKENKIIVTKVGGKYGK